MTTLGILVLPMSFWGPILAMVFILALADAGVLKRIVVWFWSRWWGPLLTGMLLGIPLTYTMVYVLRFMLDL